MSRCLRWAVGPLLLFLCFVSLWIQSRNVGSPIEREASASNAEAEIVAPELDQPKVVDRFDTASTRTQEPAQKPKSIISEIGDPLEWRGKAPAALRTRKIQLSPKIFEVSRDTFEIGELLEFQIFDGERVQARVVDQRLWGRANQTLAMRARLVGAHSGYLTLSSTGGIVRSWLNILERGDQYHIRYDPGAGSHLLMEVDVPGTHLLACGSCGEDSEHLDASTHHHSGELDWNAPIVAGSSSEPLAYGDTTLGLMVVYSPQALQVEGNLASMEATISEAVNKGNVVLENSGTLVQFNLVHTTQVNYDQSSSASLDLGRLKGVGDGYMDEVHDLRKLYGADFVSMFIDTNDAGGLGYRPSGYDRPDIAFNVVRVQQADTTSYTTIHELGHNMGIGHSKTQRVQAYNYSAYDGIAPDAAGWQWADDSSIYSIGYCSVMTYEDHDSDGSKEYQRIPHFSNPEIFYGANPTGDLNDGNAARVIRQGRSFYAAFYEPMGYPISNFPYSYGFEPDEIDWIQGPDGEDELDWNLAQTGETNSVGTGPSVAYEGERYAYLEASSRFNKMGFIYFDFDLSQTETPEFSFRYHMYSSESGTMGNLFLEASTDKGMNWTPLFSKSGDQGSMWHQSVIDLSAYAGQELRLRFRGVTGPNYRSDIALDAISLVDGIVGDPVTSFAGWLENNHPGISDTSPGGDPDKDGVNNFMEYALGRSASTPESEAPVQMNLGPQGDLLSYSFVRGQGTVRYVVQSTEDLSDWSEPTIIWDSAQSPADLVNVGEQQTVMLSITEPICFFRLSVSE